MYARIYLFVRIFHTFTISFTVVIRTHLIQFTYVVFSYTYGVIGRQLLTIQYIRMEVNHWELACKNTTNMVFVDVSAFVLLSVLLCRHFYTDASLQTLFRFIKPGLCHSFICQHFLFNKFESSSHCVFLLSFKMVLKCLWFLYFSIFCVVKSTYIYIYFSCNQSHSSRWWFIRIQAIKKGVPTAISEIINKSSKEKSVQEKSVSLFKIKKYVSFYQANQKCYIIK